MFTQGGSLGLVGVVAAGAAAVCGAQGWWLGERDHALMVVRGAVSEVFLLTLRQHLGNLVAAGVRFVVLDLAEVTACPPEVVGELATACRALYARESWLRSITTAPCVADALESADLDDLFPIYRAAGTEFRYAS